MATKTAVKNKKKPTKGSRAQSKAAAKRVFMAQVKATILFAVGIFLLLSFSFGVTGDVGSWLSKSARGLWGWGHFLIPFLVLYLSVRLSAQPTARNFAVKAWGAVLFSITISALVHLFGHFAAEESGLSLMKELFVSGTALVSGGLLGGGLSELLLMLFGGVGTGFILFAALFIWAFMTTGVTVYRLFRFFFPEKSDEDDIPLDPLGFPEKGGDSAAFSEKKRKFHIDVPLDELPPPKKKKRGQEPLEDSEPPLSPSLDDIIAKASKPANFPPLQVDKPAGEPEKIVLSKEEQLLEEKKIETAAQKLGENPRPRYVFPPVSLLHADTKTVHSAQAANELKQNAQKLVDVLSSFGVDCHIVNVSRGPTVTRYELQPSAGVRVSRITNLADDIALNLAAAGVRIEAPIPGKAAVGVEVPNKTTHAVCLRDIIESKEFKGSKSKLSFAIGKDIAGQNITADIAKMPHVLIAGATGSGKSVCINSLIVSLIYKADPNEVKLIMIDPKVVELGVYNGIPHLLVPVVTDPRKASGALGWAVTEMLNRYKLFADQGVRDLAAYNQLAQSGGEVTPLPQIVIIIDELADLMMVAPNEVEDAICRLAQMARAAGMHLVIATQRPSVDVITGTIKANIPSRISFAVSSQVDSRTILDMAGAEKLLGRGDMLFYPVGSAKPQRLQGAFITDEEVESVVKFVKGSLSVDYDDNVMDQIERAAQNQKGGSGSKDTGDGDEMLPHAIECVVESGMASVSLLQRKLKLGYARAARIVDEMETRGIVGPFEGSKPRQVLISRAQWQEMLMREENEAE